MVNPDQSHQSTDAKVSMTQQEPKKTNWARIYAFILLFNAGLVSIFYLLKILFNHVAL